MDQSMTVQNVHSAYFFCTGCHKLLSRCYSCAMPLHPVVHPSFVCHQTFWGSCHLLYLFLAGGISSLGSRRVELIQLFWVGLVLCQGVALVSFFLVVELVLILLDTIIAMSCYLRSQAGIPRSLDYTILGLETGRDDNQWMYFVPIQ